MTSFDFPSAVLGRLHARFRRVEAVLTLCFFSWAELKSKYLSVCWFPEHFDGDFSIVPADEGVQEGDLAIAFSFDGKGDLRVDGFSKGRGKLK